MTRPARLLQNSSGSAAVEMVLVLPILLALLFGSVELGNYFYNEHIVVQAVRDGARYAARQDFSNFTSCAGEAPDPVKANTQNIVKTGLLSGGSSRIDYSGATISVTVACKTNVGGSTIGGIYNTVNDSSGSFVGAPVVTVSATVPYTPILKAFGFTGVGYKLGASQQAAVTGW